MYIILLLQHVFAYTQYLPIQNQYVDSDMVYDQSKLDEYAFGYGVWMKYGPLMKIGQVGSILQNQSNNSLLTYIKDVDTQQIQMVVQLTSDYKNLIMKFEAYIYSNTQTHHIQHQIDYMNFEGFWYIMYFQCKPVLQKCQFLFSDFNINQTIYEISEKYPFQSQNIKIIVGGGLKQDQYLLTYFPGIMMYETFNQQFGWYDDINAEYFFSYAQQFDDCYQNLQSYDDIIFTHDTRIKYDQNSQNANGYTIRAWYRLIQDQTIAANVNIIRISQNGYQDFLNHIGGNAFGLSVSQDSTQIQAKFISYSYLFPTVNLDVSEGDPFEIKQLFDLVEDLNEWAYLQFSFSIRNYKMLFQIQYPEHKYQYINNNARQFSKPITTIYIGNNNYDESESQGMIKGLYFDYCEGQEDFSSRNKCDLTCETCFGPYNYQCSSCQSGSNREYQNQKHTCNCKLGYLDRGSYQCFGQDNQLILVYTQTYDCIWGQFIYNNKCYQCPRHASNSDISCIECLTNPKQWINDPYCYTNYEQQSKDSNEVYFQTFEIKKQYYLFQSEQLVAVNNIAEICSSSTDSGCYYFPLQHLDKPTFIKCLSSTIWDQEQCIECYDPNCVICTPIYMNISCSECKTSFHFDQQTKLCVWQIKGCISNTCPQFCDQFCTFCSYHTKNCKSCISGYYVGFDYKCHKCSITYCIKCFEFNMNDLNQNTLNFRFELMQDPTEVVVGCVECDEGFVYDFVKQICRPHIQVEPCLQSYVNLNQIEICTLENGQSFSGISPQISDCSILLTNCQICIKVLVKYQCVKCVEGYYADSELGTCVICKLENAIACTQCSYQDQDQSMESYQGFYQTFRTDGLIYSTQVWQLAIAATKCKQGYIIHNGVCFKYCDSNCKTCVYNFDAAQYICQECHPENGFQISSVVNGQCTQCPYLCEVCYPRKQDQIKEINTKFIIDDSNIYLTFACVKAYSNYTIDSNLQVVRYLDEQMDQGSLDIVENLKYSCSENYYDVELNYQRIKESQDLVDYLNIRQPNSFTHNVALAESIFLCQSEVFRQETILKKKVFTLNTLIFKLYGSEEYRDWAKRNFTISGYDQVYLEGFNFHLAEQQMFQLINSDYEFFVRNTTFTNFGEYTTDTYLLVQNATLINFELVDFDQYFTYNTVFMYLEQENTLVINLALISFQNCNFSNFTLFKTSSNLKNMQIYLNGVTFINCSMNNFKFTSNTFQTKNNVEIKNVVVNACTFTNTVLFNQNTNGDLKLINMHIYESKLITSSVIGLNLNSILQNIIIEKCNFYSSTIIKLNTFMVLNNQVKITISKITIYNIAYDSSRLIELDSQNFFKLNVILENISFKQNQLLNIDKHLFQGFWVIRCWSLTISNVEIVRKFVNNIEFMLTNITNIKISDISVKSENKDSTSNALITIDQFQSVHLENITITDQQVVNQPIIFISSESQIQLLDIKEEIIFIKNITFSSNILSKSIIGKFESMIYIISNHYQQIVIQDIHFQNNFIVEFVQNNQIDSSGLLYISSIYAYLILSNIFSFNDTIMNTTNTLFYIWSKTLELNFLEADKVNQVGKTQLNLGVMMLISNVINLQNVYVNQVKSQITGFMNIQTDQQGIININNLTIQGIQTLNTDPLAIDEGIIQIDNKISSLKLNITNVLIRSCILGSGGFLRINSQKMENSISLYNITLNNLYAFQCQLVCMILNNQIQYYNYLNIKNITMINDNGYEFDLFTNNKVNTYLNGIYNLIDLNNSIIEASYTNVSITNISISGPLYVGYFLLTNMQNIILDQIKLVNSDIISPNPVQFTFNNDKIAKVIFNNIIMSNITVNQLQRRLLEQQQLYGQSFIKISQIQNKHQFQFESFTIKQINCNTCSDGFVIINLIKGINIQISIQNLIFSNNQCGLANCFIITNTQLNESNVLDFTNSQLFENQANLGLMKISNISISLNNVSLIKNKALTNGSAISYDSNKTTWQNVQIIENIGIQSGGLITQSANFLNLKQSQISFLFNVAQQKPENLLCQATNLVFLFQNIHLKLLVNKINNTIINMPVSKVYGYLLFPNIEVKISSYQIYDLQKEEYIDANLKYDIFASNKYMEVFSQYQNSTCKLDIFNNESNISYSQNLQLSNQKDGSTFDNTSFRSNPYSNSSLMVVTIKCDFIQNYKYVFYAKSLPCQLGEYYFNQTCKTCDYIQGYYSVSFNATSCSKADTSLILNNTSNNLQLQQYYWRPKRLSPYIEYCHQNKGNCLGGWSTGDQSCLKGHLGALCEQCDIYNTRGDGQFSQNYGVICVSCQSTGIQILAVLGTLIWTLISTYVTVRSIIQSNLKLKQLKKINRKFFQILFRQDQDQSSTLLKMAIYDMQIIQAIYTFQITFSFNMSSFNDFISYPVESVAYNIECNLSQNSAIPIIYLRIIWILFISMFTIVLFIMVYLTYIVIQKQRYESVVIYTSLLYMFVYTQPYIMRQVSSLVASRTISNLKWIQGNVTYRYDTVNHYKWILGFAVPVIIFFGVTIPLLFFILLYRHRQNLYFDVVRNKIGYLYNEYRQHSFYWENVKILHMQLIIFILTIYQDEIQLKACIIYLIVFLYYVLQQNQQPYNQSRLNKFDNKMIFAIGVCLILSQAIYSSQQANLFNFKQGLEIILNMLLFYIYINFLIKLIFALFQRLDQQIDKLKDFIKSRTMLSKLAPRIIRYLINRTQQKARVQRRFQLIRNYLIERVQGMKNYESILKSQQNEISKRSRRYGHQIQFKSIIESEQSMILEGSFGTSRIEKQIPYQSVKSR